MPRRPRRGRPPDPSATLVPACRGWRRTTSPRGWPSGRNPRIALRQVADGLWASGAGGARTAAEIRTLPAGLRAGLDAAFRLDTLAETEVQVSRRRADREGAPSPVGRRARRVGPHALPGAGGPPRAAHRLHLEPGRLRRRLPVLRDRRARLHARPRDRRDRRPGPRRGPPARRRRPAPHERRVHGDGRAAPQPRPRPRGGRPPCPTGAGSGSGARHITVSTSGVVPGIRRLTALGPQFTLAVSLHAARDPLRDVLVPLNRRWPVAEVVAAARDHARATGRRISLRAHAHRRDQRHAGGRRRPRRRSSAATCATST